MFVQDKLYLDKLLTQPLSPGTCFSLLNSSTLYLAIPVSPVLWPIELKHLLECLYPMLKIWFKSWLTALLIQPMCLGSQLMTAQASLSLPLSLAHFVILTEKKIKLY